MDELSNFRFAPAELIERERLLLAHADVVFAGGYRLAQSKAKHHSNVHFFGCGVDAAHFSAALSEDTVVPESITTLGKKVIGYYGVIDERIDYALLAHLAGALPNVAIAMVGPVVKVAPHELPQAANIHWLGQQDYRDLPAFVKGFDVCLMPFALNEATEYINPTKTLEYMAAGKPIVSTAVSDVVRNFTPVVTVATSHATFVDAVRQSLANPDLALIKRGLEQAAESSWDSVVARMESKLHEVIRVRDAHARPLVGGAISPTRVDRPAAPRVAFTAIRDDIG
jgi:glycosyltransferase involved in cell wall biosynthesis